MAARGPDYFDDVAFVGVEAARGFELEFQVV